jgi:hypothetical protein
MYSTILVQRGFPGGVYESLTVNRFRFADLSSGRRGYHRARQFNWRGGRGADLQQRHRADFRQKLCELPSRRRDSSDVAD